MAIDLDTLQTRYLDLCKKQEVLPNSAILTAFSKVKLQKFYNKLCGLQVFLDQLNDLDLPPLIDLLPAIDSSEIDAIDILHGSPSVLNGEYVLSLMRAVNQKLRTVDLHDSSFGKEFLRDLLCGGLTCQVLNLRSFHIRKLNMSGKFMQLHTLNLDFSISLTSFQEDCFTCMPNLMCVSMCETRISNLWNASAAISKLPSLVELRFQNCLCCNDTRPCSTSLSKKANPLTFSRTGSNHLGVYSHLETPSIGSGDLVSQTPQYSRRQQEETHTNLVINHVPLENTTEESSEASDDSELDFSSHQQRTGMEELMSDLLSGLSRRTLPEEGGSLADVFNLRQCIEGAQTKKYAVHHPSPICFEKHYREYMVVSLPRLKVLDNLPINDPERESAKVIISKYYEHCPYNRQGKENLVSVLQKREMGATISYLPQLPNMTSPYPIHRSQHFFSRSICAAKVGSFSWPLLHPVSKLSRISMEESKSSRPRQFEYHPLDSSLMVFGTLDGEVVVINHESGKLVGYLSSIGTSSSVLGLSWLRRYPSKLIVGSDNGSLQLYDIRQMLLTQRHQFIDSVTFDDFEQLTSVHVNSTDEYLIASGYSKNVALYDISSGKRIQMFADMHRGHINVVKFSNHSPSMFATASFDRDVKMWDLRQRPTQPCYTTSSSRGNVTVCFSPDDHYLLTSSVDNEVKQLLAVDGRTHMKFDIASTGSSQNYTRSYYMNGRDYIISGSSDEHVIRICCAQTGRRLRDVSLEVRGSANAMFVQSLRGDPFRGNSKCRGNQRGNARRWFPRQDFHMSVLATYMRPSSKSEIIKINLMTSGDPDNVHSCHQQNSRPSFAMGG